MPRKGENIYKRKDGRWEGRYVSGRDVLTNKAIYGYVYASSYNECKHLKAVEEAAEKKRAAVNKSITVGDCLDLWLAERRAEPHLHAGTIQQYERHIEKHIKPALGRARVYLLTGELIYQFRLKQLRAGRLDGKGGLSPSVVNTQMVVLFSMLHYALRQKLIVTIPELPGKKQAPEGSGKDVRVLEHWEQERLEAVVVDGLLARSTEYHGLAMGVFFALFTGLRVGELGGLQWRDLSFTATMVTVRHTLQRISAPTGSAVKTVLDLGPPKTQRSRRTIPMNQTLSLLMQQYSNRLPPSCKRPTDPVFTYHGKSIEPRLFQQFFKRLMYQAGLAAANFHALRHSFATRCLEQGMDFQTLSEVLGHSNATITAKRYAHSMVQHKAECMDRLTVLVPNDLLDQRPFAVI